MNKILLIFYGGSGLSKKKKGLFFVEKEKDISQWLNLVPEISLMAEVKTAFIDKSKEVLNQKNIKKIIQIIKENENQVDGVVILNDPDTIPLLANQLYWQIQNPNRPIIITGSNIIEKASEILPDLSFKANLINSFQVVNSNMKEVAVIYGNRVISAPKIVRTKLHDLNIFKSINKDYLAKIDFGLSIKNRKVKKGKIKYYDKFKYNFLFFNNVPKLENLEILLNKDNNLRIIIFKALPNQIIDREKLVNIFKLAEKNKKIIIFYNQIGFGRDFFKDTIITISKISPECLSAKLSWILGQTKDEKKIRELLKKEIQDEFLDI
ncbi:asparaginase domain-containing protein [bacterium]|nr:asparaginase domain-containing protein [bacterium]